jgi:hypothetical protein
VITRRRKPLGDTAARVARGDLQRRELLPYEVDDDHSPRGVPLAGRLATFVLPLWTGTLQRHFDQGSLPLPPLLLFPTPNLLDDPGIEHRISYEGLTLIKVSHARGTPRKHSLSIFP